MRNHYCSYDEAHLFASSLLLNSETEWYSWLQDNDKPACIPDNPAEHYSDTGWINWDRFFSVDVAPRAYIKFRSYPEARKFVVALSLNSKEHWDNYDKSQLPDDIPLLPEIVYRGNGWIRWPHWLGTEK